MAGKSTFLKILSGEIDPTTGQVSITPGERMSVLKQNHFAFDDYSVLHTVMMGNAKLLDIMEEKDAIYAKPDFSESGKPCQRSAEIQATSGARIAPFGKVKPDMLKNNGSAAPADPHGGMPADPHGGSPHGAPPAAHGRFLPRPAADGPPDGWIRRRCPECLRLRLQFPKRG